jgi:excinuclease ABC subunit C
MQKCSAPCVGLISDTDYRKDLDAVIEVLEGNAEPILKPLREKMNLASSNEDFEYAALLRDQIQAIELVVQTQSVSNIHGRSSFDVVAIAKENLAAQFSLIQVRKSKVIAVRHFQLANVDPSMRENEIFQAALEQFYLLTPDERNDATQTERAVLCRFSDQTEIQEAAKNLNLILLKPETPQDDQLLKVAQINADYALKEALKRAHSHGIEALEDVQKTLGLFKLPHRIECFDISNFQGTGSVASRVVFVDGEPDKSLYRRYKIQTVDGQNDFAMMKEVLGRRFKNDESLPDLVIVDGGKGQLSQAKAIIDELSVSGVAVAALAKARTESNFRAKEVESSSERIFIPGRKNPILLKPHTAAFRLLTHIRDEAHRFAISYQRRLRGKS